MLSETHTDALRAIKGWCTLAFTIRALALVVALVSTAAGAAGVQISGDIVRIEGAVYGQGGHSVVNARVRLESDEGDQIWESGLDEQGRYAFTGLRRGIYQLVAAAGGYETYRETIDLTRTPAT